MSILLDEQNVAKLFDFSLATSILKDKTHLDDGVMGTIGYIAREYMNAVDCNEKCNVFSFGMLELLTRQRVSGYLVRIAGDDDCFLLEYLKNIKDRFVK